jgi:hypothetical protein
VVRKKWIALSLFALAAMVMLFISGPFQKKRPFLRIPIVIAHGQPCVHVNIEGKSYLFHLDSGASDCFSMNREALEVIQSKRWMGMKTWRDINSNEYTTPIYAIGKVDVDGLQIVDSTVVEESRDFLFSGSQLTPCSRSNEAMERELAAIAGRLGPKTLRALDYWLIDLPNLSLVVFRDFEKMKGGLEGLIEVPLEKTTPHIVISVHTDVGIKKLAIDTGAFHSVLTSVGLDKELKTNKLGIGGRDFGAFHFYLTNMPKEFPFDGVLGRDFLQNHRVYLDFKMNRAFISLDN